MDSTQRFSTRVEAYVKYRPGYPVAMLDFLVDELAMGPEAQVADIGAGTGILTALLGFAVILLAMGVWTESKAVLAVSVIVAGAFLGINNTLITEAVMKAAPVERPVASAAYSFVRFSGGAVAPWAAGRLGEEVGLSAPFWMGTVAVLVGVAIFTYGSRFLRGEEAPATHSDAEVEAVLVGDAD